MTLRAVDLFAGAGGSTTGAIAAGARVVWAANHWQLAVEVHASNHPDVAHACQDLRQADFSALPEFDLLLASPACQGHSSASQPRRRPKHDADRSTAWAVVDCAETCLPPFLVVENVPAFRRWQLYPTWRQALQVLGYDLQEAIIDAADVGVPQHRRRLFVVGSRGGTRVDLQLERAAATASAAAVVDWTVTEGWAPIASKPAGVQVRVARGRARGLGGRFLVHYSSDNAGRDLARPLCTVTTKNQIAVVDGDRIRMLTVPEVRRAMAFPDGYRLPAAKGDAWKLLGNAVCPPVAALLVRRVMEAAA